MQARYYDPVIGRFYSNDPVGTLSHLNGGNGIQGFNRYAYANNNPYKYVDPDGNAIQLAGANAAGIAGTFVCGPVCGGIAWVGGLVVTTLVVNEIAEAVMDETTDSGDWTEDSVYDVETDSWVIPTENGGDGGDDNNNNKDSKSKTKKANDSQNSSDDQKGHTKNKRKSNKKKHEKGDKRRQKDKGGEKGDARRKY